MYNRKDVRSLRKVYVTNDRTGIEYMVEACNYEKGFPVGWSGLKYEECFKVSIYKPAVKILWKQFYKLVWDNVLPVTTYNSVSECVYDVCKGYFEYLEKLNREKQEFAEVRRLKEQELENKYDSLPSKITIK